MTDAQETRDSELQNVEESGAPVRRRIASPAAAYNIFKRLKELDNGDARRRATLQGMINGNPPYNPKELRDKGLAHLCNVNFMTMRANLDSRAASAHELLIEVPTLVELKPRKAMQLNPEVYHWCSVVAEEFSSMVSDWDGFIPAMDLAVRESDAYGIGYVLFPDKWDWRFKASRRGALLFDPKASVNVDENDLFMVRDEMSAGELYDAISDEDAAVKLGWNISAVKKYLVRIFRSGEGKDTAYNASMWESVQHMIRNNDELYQEKQFEQARIVHVLVRENSGDRKVSHYIIPDSDLEHDYLLADEDAYANMSEAIWWLPYNYGDGYARSVRGVASLMAQHDDLSNRFLCEVFNLGFLSTKMIFEPQTPGDLGKLQFMQHGNFVVSPPGLKAIQTSFRPQIAPLIQLRDVSEKVLMNNTGLYKQHSESIEREATKTARQVMEETSKEARFEKAAVAHRYTLYDKLYREMFRRVFSEAFRDGEADYPGKKNAKAMYKRCEERGVDKKFLNNLLDEVYISATRALGMGSAGVKMDITNQLVQASSMFDEQGRREALRDWVSVRVGHRNADKYVLKLDRDTITSNEASISMLEWNDTMEGSQVIVGTDQNHKIHLGVYMTKTAELIQSFEQGQLSDVAVGARTLELAIQHIVTHAQQIMQDPRYADFIKQVEAFLKIAQQALQQMQRIAQQMAKQQQQRAQQQQEVVQNAEQVMKDRELEAKIYEVNRKYQLETLKQESLNEARRTKSEAQMDISRQKAAATTQLSAERQAAELAMAQARTSAEIELKRSKAGA